MEVAGTPKSFCNFDLELYLTESGTGLTIDFRYNTDLFDDGTVQRWMGHYETLLEGIIADPDRFVSELPLLTQTERHLILTEWNNTKAKYLQDKCLHQLFEAQVERTPEAIAVVFEGQQLTYRELNARANQLAHHLRKLGVGPEVLVGICVERSLAMVVGLLGILKAGGAYVPSDAAYPKERLAFMLDDSQALLLLTQEHLVESLPEYGDRLVCLDRDWEIIAAESAENPISEATHHNLAYVIYTSGSTGKPKGVEIQHAALINWSTGISGFTA